MIISILVLIGCLALIAASFYWEKWLCKRNNWPYEPAPWRWAPWLRWRTWLVYVLSIVCLLVIVNLLVCVVILFL